MDFCIDPDNSIHVQKQLQDQIKSALMLGTLRTGDRLPSLRDVAKQTGIKLGHVHRAYMSLEKSGVLVLLHRKGAVVATPTAFPGRGRAHRTCDALAKNMLEKIRGLGISPTAFARYLTQQAQVTEHGAPLIAYAGMSQHFSASAAAEISRLWQVRVVGFTYPELKKALAHRWSVRKILTDQVQSDYVRSLVRTRKIDVIPVKVDQTPETIDRFRQIKSGSSVLLISPDDFLNPGFAVTEVRNLMKCPGISITGITASDVARFEDLLNDSQYDLAVMGRYTFEKLPEALRRNPRILIMDVQLDLPSVEAARIRAGVIV